MNASPSLRIDRARWWALSNHPFYGSLAMKLPDEITTSVDTAATDGRVIKWNPGFVDGLTDEQLRFVLLHETLHCAHQHMWRLPADERGNAAGDHAINNTLKQVSGISMPDGGLCDPSYRDMAEEDILRAMPEPEPDDGGSGGGPGGGQPDPCGSFTSPGDGDGQGDSDGQGGGQGGGQSAADKAAANQELRESWETAVIQAAQAAQASGQGHIPADMARVLEKLRAQPIDWRRELADFVHSTVSHRNDWSRSARRHAWQPVIYPRKRADELGTVIFARDTSGSVDDKTLAAYSALISDCTSETGCDALVLDCDAAIQAEYELAAGDPCPLTAQGGGGTDFRPVFNRADEIVAAGGTVAGIVYMTDLDGRFPAMPSELATLWLAVPNRYSRADTVAPFGRTVKVAQ